MFIYDNEESNLCLALDIKVHQQLQIKQDSRKFIRISPELRSVGGADMVLLLSDDGFFSFILPNTKVYPGPMVKGVNFKE